MALPHIVQDDRMPISEAVPFAPKRAWSYVLVGAALAVLIGTWLVWFSAAVQRKFHEDDIRAACQRVMPETAERCFDTVVIQRGGVRR